MRRLALWVSVAAVLGTARVAGAESLEVEDSDRELGGHIFVPSRLVQTPFSVTSFSTTTLAGKGTATGTRLDINGNAVGTRDFDLAAFGQGFDFTGRINPASRLGSTCSRRSIAASAGRASSSRARPR